MRLRNKIRLIVNKTLKLVKQHENEAFQMRRNQRNSVLLI